MANVKKPAPSVPDKPCHDAPCEAAPQQVSSGPSDQAGKVRRMPALVSGPSREKPTCKALRLWEELVASMEAHWAIISLT